MAQSLQIPVEINLKTKKEDFDKILNKLENKKVDVRLKVTNEELKNFRETIQKKFSQNTNSVSIGLAVKTTTVKELRKEIQKKFTKQINVPLSVTQGQVNKLRNKIQKASKKPIEISVKADTESLKRVKEQILRLGSQQTQQKSGSSSNINAFSKLLNKFNDLGGNNALSDILSSVSKVASPLGFITSGFSLFSKQGENFFKTTAKIAQTTINVVIKLASNIKKVVSVIGSAVNNIKGNFNILNSTLARGLSLAALTALGRKCLELSSDLIEVQNVVDTTFGKSSSIINDFAANALKNFGLTELQAKKYASTLGAIAKASGESDDATLQMSTNLTKLTADVASFFNYDYDTAFNKIRSGLTGETEPLKDLGVVMTVANLEQYRLAHGIKTAYSEMSSAEQMALRYNYIMQALTDTQGDFNKTQASWANQLRVLQGQAQQLGAILGNLLQKVLYPVLSVVNVILGKAVAMGNALAKAFGFDTKAITESQSGKGETGSTALTDTTGSPNLASTTDKEAKSQDNLAKSTKKATAEKKKQNKEREKELAGVHKLNILNKKQAKSTKASTGKGAKKSSKSTSGINVNGGLGFDLLNYADVTNKGAKNTETAFENFIKRMKKLAKEGQFEGIGASLADEVNGLVSKVHFKEVEGKFTNFANKIGRVINGFVRNLNTAQIGRKLGDLTNLIVHTINTFYETIDFSAIGSQIATSLNSMFETIDWVALGQFLLNKLNSIFRLLAGFAETFDWISFGIHLSELINSAFDSIDFKAIESFVINGVNGITDAIWDVLFGTDWGARGKELGQSISRMIQGIKWNDIATNLAHGLASLLDFGINFAEQVLSDDNLSKITNAITTFFTKFFEEVKDKKLGKRLAELINKGVKILNDLINEIPWKDIYDTIDDFITNLDWAGILRNIAHILLAKKAILINAGLSIMNGVFKSIIDSIGEEIDKLTNKIYYGLIDGLNSLPFINIKTSGGGGTSIDGSYSRKSKSYAPLYVPHLAKGAVIPPNNKFLAMLGDQTSGTNIETPLGTMVEAFKTALSDSNYSGMGDIYIPIYVNNELTSEELIRKQEIERYRSNGKH